MPGVFFQKLLYCGHDLRRPLLPASFQENIAAAKLL